VYAGRIKGWLKALLHDRRLRKNISYSLAGWVMVQQVVFHALMAKGLDSHAAKALCSPIGAPIGVAIQLVVFGDRARMLVKLRSLRMVFGSGKYAGGKVGMFFFNQALYAALLHQASLSPTWANTAAAPVGSLLSYGLCMWATNPGKQTGEIETAEP
jgi:hypothetical protein